MHWTHASDGRKIASRLVSKHPRKGPLVTYRPTDPRTQIILVISDSTTRQELERSKRFLHYAENTSAFQHR